MKAFQKKTLRRTTLIRGTSVSRNLKFPPKAGKKTRPYDPAFVAKILESREQIRQGNFVVIAIEDLWKPDLKF